MGSYRAVARAIAISIWRWARTARLVISDLLIALSRSRRLNCKGRSSTSRIAGAVQPAGRSVPEHDPCKTSEHRTTARWIRQGVGFWGGRKPECAEKTLEVTLRSTKTQPTYNMWQAWLIFNEYRKSIQMVTYPDINPIQQGLTSVNGREPVFPFGSCRTRLGFGQSRSGRLITNSVYTWVSEWHICISESPQETRFYASRIHEFNKNSHW
mgnify:CR=1 FL=1